MCPLCIGTALWVAGSTSAGGIVVAAAVRLAGVAPRQADAGAGAGTTATMSALKPQPPAKVPP